MYSKYGISCFMSDNVVQLTGQIKCESTDFQVDEIDVEGHIAGGGNLGQIPNKRRKLEATRTETVKEESNIIPTTVKSEIPWSDVKVDPEKRIAEMIGKDLFSTLSELAALCKPDLKEIDVGCFDDKDDRSIFHQCVRYIFPQVRSFPLKDVADNERTRIKCKIDPAFLELKGIGVCEDVAKKLMVFINCRLLKGTMDDKQPYTFDVSELERASRTRLHHFLQKRYGKFLESKTFFNKTHSISVRFKERKEPFKRNKRKHQDEIHRVVLRKTNMELIEALDAFSRELKVDLSRIKYAGIKDKRAVTHQFITVSGANESELKAIAETDHLGWAILCPVIEEVATELKLGDLSGNRFKIWIRNLQGRDGLGNLQENISSSIASITQHGFLNYFGEQRFGLDMSTPTIGKQLLLGNFIEAINILFKSLVSGDSSSAQQPLDAVEKAKEVFTNTRDVKAALNLMPTYKVRECSVLKALNRYTVDEDGCVKGFMSLPFAVRLFYVHSYCSYVWNVTVTRRIQKYGFCVLPGDLVYESDESADVKVLTKNDIDQGVYSIKDVVMPLPGTSVQFPSNDTKDIYVDVLKEDNLDLTSFKIRKLNMNNIPGAYRNVVALPYELSWELKNDTSDLYLEFVLQSSSYATMLLRELLHSECVLS